MCLVSFWKMKSGKVIMTSNRDEAPARSVNQIQNENIEGQSLVYPQDTEGGSWFFISSKKSVAIVLNGAFKTHKRQDKYRMSRGLMLKEYFSFENFPQFLNLYDFQNIEPFTMIVFENEKLYEFRWDGAVKDIEVLSIDELHVWSSCTLYTTHQEQLRKNKFLEMFQEGNTEPVDQLIKDIHLKGKVGNPQFDFLMNREERVKTISFSQAIIKQEKIEFSFENLLYGGLHQEIVAI